MISVSTERWQREANIFSRGCHARGHSGHDSSDDEMRNGEGSALQDGSKDADPLRYDDAQASSQFITELRGNYASEKATQIVHSNNGPGQRGRRISELRTKGFGIDNAGKDGIVVSKKKESGSRRTADCNYKGIPSNGAETHGGSMVERNTMSSKIHVIYSCQVNKTIRLDFPTGNCMTSLPVAGKTGLKCGEVGVSTSWRHEQQIYLYGCGSPAPTCNFHICGVRRQCRFSSLALSLKDIFPRFALSSSILIERW
jgi:hypothetical protein